ncbi:MAG: phosphoribosylaminoimidazolecarboxamide formyltransferase / IMP cyclohydrolase [Parcubacteria group bacterium Gr01-1014_48]|nr:MAG: phosphoribosylaminoimidazolecarboxamide formyltransferase / IMP cyclohydrolase [Parcubacteria group bacterium Greene0416_14]TSC73896.1 MAG: phosphoribosylaminoimidazolecarboxamide formyltransferase / IMP cyclohydrolase [Parcubacteria group bacterium Gr01-1014_48]TSC99867.1 MAG: phosphoribosylaminoimidazolecarboxamide formyltransferase / IMP cyclohydrolase [Parcubacteria group bacterium Greene1014_15]TSD06688.1 MAG: phosphoribosylaminoimidazolecarboxamide formyltransferase / IMP cyclohydr
MPTALISVSDKNGIELFARGLVEQGFDILASDGTAKYLLERGVAVRDIASLARGGPILGHRVVTLSREIHVGILTSDSPEDTAELKSMGLPRIDLVCVDIYPLKKTITMHGTLREKVLEQTDVGGIALLHAAAKGRRIVIAHPRDRAIVLAWLKEGRPHEDEFITELAIRAEAVVADYCLASARYHSKGRYDGFVMSSVRECAYGENAWQVPSGLMSLAKNDPLALDLFVHEGGMSPSYNNLIDVDRLLQTMTHIIAIFDVHKKMLGDFHGKYIGVAGKHGNACGAAVGNDAANVVKKTIDGDTRAIFGGVMIVNFPVDLALVEVLLSHSMPKGVKRLLDVVIAPSFSAEARDMLSARKGNKCRLLSNQALATLGRASLDSHTRYRYVRGGFLRQPNYTQVPNFTTGIVERSTEIEPHTLRDMLLASAIGATSNSNTITLVHNGMLIGNGVGQQDRIGACSLALRRAHDAGHSTVGAVAYSDSFFPFIDGPETLAHAGIQAIFTSSGSVRDEDVRQFCKKRGITLCMIPDALGRGFFGH